MFEPLDKFNAFLALSDLDEDVDLPKVKSLEEGMVAQVNNFGDLSEVEDFLNDKKEPEIEVIDINADSLDHLENNKSYVGQVIAQCNVCKGNRFVDVAEIEKDLDSTDGFYLIKDDNECPFCHSEDTNYTLVGQVGEVPVEDEQPEVDLEAAQEEQDEVSLENDEKSDNEPTFDNDVESEVSDEEAAIETEEPQETTEEVTEETQEDSEDSEILDVETDNEKDGMESEEDDTEEDKDEKEVKESFGELFVQDDFNVEKDDTDDDLDEDLETDGKISYELDDACEEMNEICKAIGKDLKVDNGILFITKSSDDDTFGICIKEEDKDSVLDEVDAFLKEYGVEKGSGYKVTELQLEDSDEYDVSLLVQLLEALHPINEAVEERKEEDVYKPEKVSDFINLIIEPEQIKEINILAVDSNGKDFVLERVRDSEAIPEKLLNTEFESFKTGDDLEDQTVLTIDYDSKGRDKTILVEDVLNIIKDHIHNNICFEDISTLDEYFKKPEIYTFEEAIEKFGKYPFIGIESPEVVDIYVKTEVSPEVKQDDVQLETQDILVNDIIDANEGLSRRQLSNVWSNEYAIMEAVKEKEDLDLIFEHYVKNSGKPELIKEFKEVTGYKDIVDLALEQYNESADTKLELKENVIDDHIEFNQESEINDDSKKDEVVNENVLDVNEPFFTEETKENTDDHTEELKESPVDTPVSKAVDAYKVIQETAKEFVKEDPEYLDSMSFDFIESDKYYKIEVRTEFSSSTMSQLETLLDKKIAEFYPDAYFEPEDSCRYISCIIWKDWDKTPETDEEDDEEPYVPHLATSPLAAGQWYESKTTSFKSRKELSEAIKNLEEKHIEYKVRKSVTEGYRYDLIEKVEDIPQEQLEKITFLTYEDDYNLVVKRFKYDEIDALIDFVKNNENIKYIDKEIIRGETLVDTYLIWERDVNSIDDLNRDFLLMEELSESITESKNDDDFYGAKIGTEEADDILFALQVT